MYYLYILQSTKVLRFYIGVTRDLEVRLKNHNRGTTKSTKPYRPWIQIYHEIHNSKEQAYKREYFLKHPAGYLEKRKIIEKYQVSV